MQGDLAGPHLQGDGRVAVVGGVVDGLGEHVVLGGGAVAEGELGVVVRATDDVHGGVVDVDVVDRRPGRDDPAGRERPVGGVLVPADPLGVAGQLGEQVAVAQHHGVAQQVRNSVDDAAVGHDVPDAPAVLVPVDHLVVVPPRRQRPRQQVVDVGPNLGDLGRREDVDGEQMTRLVVPANLGGREDPRFVDTQRDEPQVTIQVGKGVGSMGRQGESLVPGGWSEPATYLLRSAGRRTQSELSV